MKFKNYCGSLVYEQGRSEAGVWGGLLNVAFVGTSRVIIGKLRSEQISGSGSCWKITFVMIIIFRKKIENADKIAGKLDNTDNMSGKFTKWRR